MLAPLILVPLLAGLVVFVWPSNRGRRALLVLTALVHAGLTSVAWIIRPAPELQGWLALDAPGLLFLGIASALFLAASVYCVGYLGGHEADVHPEERSLFRAGPEAVFCGCLLLFLSSMTLVTLSHHFGLLWVGVEATTLASARLIYFHNNPRSLEAMWKYLLICS